MLQPQAKPKQALHSKGGEVSGYELGAKVCLLLWCSFGSMQGYGEFCTPMFNAYLIIA